MGTSVATEPPTDEYGNLLTTTETQSEEMGNKRSMNIRKPEVLAPAGDWERFQFALQYGADAIYLGGKQFTMRAAPANFTAEQLAAAGQLAPAKGVKVYLTCNTLPHNADLPQFLPYLREMQKRALMQ